MSDSRPLQLSSNSRSRLDRRSSFVCRIRLGCILLMLAMISIGFGCLCCAAVIAPLVLFVRLALAVRSRSVVPRLVVYAFATSAAMWGAYWCWLILESSWILISRSGGPGPFGLLAFPFWAAIAALPAVLGWIILSSLRTRGPGNGSSS